MLVDVVNSLNLHFIYDSVNDKITISNHYVAHSEEYTTGYNISNSNFLNIS